MARKPVGTLERAVDVADWTDRITATPVLCVGPGWRARVHFYALLAGLVLLRWATGGRGLRKVARVLAALFGRQHYAVFEVFGNRRMKVLLGDPYWIPPLMQYGGYEKNVQHVLQTLLPRNGAFLDCGANVGWWSIFASRIIPMRGSILALEACAANYDRLCDNAEINSGAFLPLNAAVWGRTGETLRLRIEDHSTPSVVPNPEQREAQARGGSAAFTENGRRRGHHRQRKNVEELVSTIALDDLVEWHYPSLDIPFVLKLDVEGAERMALLGARKLLARNTMVIYEDHGMDPDCQVTQALLEAGMAIFYCDDDLRVHRVRDLHAAQAIKRRRDWAYNYVACRAGTGFYETLTRLALEQVPIAAPATPTIPATQPPPQVGLAPGAESAPQQTH